MVFPQVDETSDDCDTPENVTVQMASSSPVHRSSSANELDVIVDLLGIPQDPNRNKRLILLNKEENEEDEEENSSEISARHPSLAKCGKSRSCGSEEVRMRKRRRRADSRKSIELKRRSAYSGGCKGREGLSGACDDCEDVARKVNDKKLNKEIFDLRPDEEEVEVEEEEEKRPESPFVPPDPLPSIRENIPITDKNSLKICGENTSQPSRRFDSVRSLLEKARNILLFASLKNRRSRSRSRGKGDVIVEQPQQPQPAATQEQSAADLAYSHSSPNTPLASRRRKTRARSFSPVK